MLNDATVSTAAAPNISSATVFSFLFSGIKCLTAIETTLAKTIDAAGWSANPLTNSGKCGLTCLITCLLMIFPASNLAATFIASLF